ncbi:MAG: hypothetical protein AB8F95_02305 [Bacteroidia bacterium]
MKLRYYALLIILISGTFIGFTIQDGHKWGGDFSLYIHQAKHIAEGTSLDELYAWNKTSMQASLRQLGPYLYPNGFPVLLSPVYGAFGMNFIAMKVFCSLLFLLSIPLMLNLFKDRFNTYTLPIILVALIACNSHLIAFSDNILSDFPFFFFCLLAFNLMEAKRNITNQVLLGLCLFYAYFIRDAGLFLLPALAVYQLFYSKKNTANRYLAGIPYLVFGALFVVSKFVFPDGGENHMGMLFSKFSTGYLLDSVKLYLTLLSKTFFLDKGTYALGALIVALSILGLVKTKKRDAHFFIFILLNLLVLMVWPARQGERFLFPMLPFLLFFSIQGLVYIFEKVKLKQTYLQYSLIAFLLFTAFYSYQKVPSERDASNQAYTKEMVVIYDYIAQLEATDAVVGFHKPRVLWLFSGVRSVYTDLDHFDSAIANFLLLKKHDNMDLSDHRIEQDFQDYVLIGK